MKAAHFLLRRQTCILDFNSCIPMSFALGPHPHTAKLHHKIPLHSEYPPCTCYSIRRSMRGIWNSILIYLARSGALSRNPITFRGAPPILARTMRNLGPRTGGGVEFYHWGLFPTDLKIQRETEIPKSADPSPEIFGIPHLRSSRPREMFRAVGGFGWNIHGAA